MNTTAEQRKAWAEVHKALTDYIIRFGSIEVGRGECKFYLDDEIRYTSCGKIYCPSYCFGLTERGEVILD